MTLRTALSLAMFFVFGVVMVPASLAQTFNVLYSFGSGPGQYPDGTLIKDGRGNLYGTTTKGGYRFGYGVVYELLPHGGSWTINPAYEFRGPLENDGSFPYSGVVVGPDGSLYGTTSAGGGGSGLCTCGIVYKLQPPPSFCRTVLCPWTETILYNFLRGGDGNYPGYGNVTFDHAGNLYGTTTQGGAYGKGAVYKLSHSQSGWTETVIYSFAGGSDGATPQGSVIFDNAGNLYGTTSQGGGVGSGCYPADNDCGTIFQLTPSGSGWTERVIYRFQNGADGSQPVAGLVQDSTGNFYGSTSPSFHGTIFELSPSNGGWILTTLSSQAGTMNPLVQDAAGNLYDVTLNPSQVFKLQRGNNGWTYIDLHDFVLEADGSEPIAGPLIDANGNIFGTASQDGQLGYGTVWEITQ